MYECVALVGVLPSRVHAYTYLHTPSGGKERGGDRKEISVLLTASSERASERHERERESAIEASKVSDRGLYAALYTHCLLWLSEHRRERERERVLRGPGTQSSLLANSLRELATPPSVWGNRAGVTEHRHTYRYVHGRLPTCIYEKEIGIDRDGTVGDKVYTAQPTSFSGRSGPVQQQLQQQTRRRHRCSSLFSSATPLFLSPLCCYNTTHARARGTTHALLYLAVCVQCISTLLSACSPPGPEISTQAADNAQTEQRCHTALVVRSGCAARYTRNGGSGAAAARERASKSIYDGDGIYRLYI